MAHTWHLRCLICKATPLDCDEYQREKHGDLVALQHHAMLDHNVGHRDFQLSKREPPHGIVGDQADVFRWQLPDGRWWLIAIRIPSDPVPMKPGDKTAVDYVREQRR